MRNNLCGVTRRGIVVLIAVIGVVLCLALAWVAPWTPHGRRYCWVTPCRNNLNYLAKGMALYLNEFGDNRWYPCPLGRGTRPQDYNGAEWLATLYWTGCVPDWDRFVCPAADDTNEEGRQLGTHHAVAGVFGSGTVSYAGMHYRSLTDKRGGAVPGAIPEDFDASEPMAADDTQGAVNHGNDLRRGMNVVFFDSHVEWKEPPDIDLERGVGQKGGLLWWLRN